MIFKIPEMQDLRELSYLNFFLITVLSFLCLYFIFSGIAYYLFVKRDFFSQYQKKSYRPQQIQIEIRRSLVSIGMFGLLSFWMKWAIDQGIYQIRFDFSWLRWSLEILGLFLWNEIYFYAVHRTFHLRSLYRFHADHHFSHVPTPFSAYSFHWTEGLLLGAVMPFALFVHDFQFWSLMSLPVMSILMNVLGHSNIDFFPERPMEHWLSFSKRHSEHHRMPRAHFGFFLPWLDQLFGTTGESDATDSNARKPI